ncbi:PTS sugar transporter subunit IIA [Streptobacillus felis]|uniref:PTS sugar transporter subunit IIA n=1 Tax=Streptobacillus felis TaxID=1384509 RepID=A0A7Z0TAE4_9FUSO|nr:PTS sugar transporter subunit IIA [Streptobacillus felis]NYV27922.1 PTS sugar transporter subunit IIA [Streptobacillus felis]
MILNERELRILEKFYYYKIISLSQLSDEFEISERMIRYNIDRINTLLSFIKISPIRKHSKGHLILDNNKSNKLIEVLKELKPIDKSNRLLLIQFMISFSKKHLTITYLSEYFQVSRITINTDIKEINREISKMNVKIVNENGLKIEGLIEEKNKYKLWILNENIEYIYKSEFESMSSKIKDILYQNINPNLIEKIIEISNEVIAEYKLEVDFLNYKLFLSKMLNVFLKDKNNIIQNIELLEEYKYVIDKIKLHDIKEFIDSKQINEMVEIILWIKSYENYEEYYENGINIEVLVKNIINNVENDLNINFLGDELLFEFLIQHIKSLMFKIDKGYELKDSIVEEKVEDNLYFSIKNSMKIMTEIIGKNIDDDEIHLLKLHFLASIERILKQESKPTKVVVITSLGPGSSKILLDNIKSKFLIDVVFVGPLYQLDSVLEQNPNVKYILSTIEIDKMLYLDKEIVRINTILSKEDKNKLSNLGFRTNNNKINLSDLLNVINISCKVESKEVLIENLMKNFGDRILNNVNKEIEDEEVLHTENIIFDNEISSLEEAIKETCQILEKEYISPSYTKEVMDIYRKNPNYIIRYNGVILPHTRNKGNVHKNGVSIMTLKEPLSINGTLEKIDTIVTFVIKDEKNISNTISNIINKVFKEDFRRVIGKKEKIELIKFLND